jgi:hypothetical protein
MNVGHHDDAVSGIAAAIGEPARARMLFCSDRWPCTNEHGACCGGQCHAIDCKRAPAAAEGAAVGEGPRPGEASLLQS